MSTASEVRDALTKEPDLSIGDILEQCSGDVTSSALATVLKQMLDRGEITRAGNPGSYKYTLVADYKAAKRGGTPDWASTAPPPKPVKATKPAKAPTKAKAAPPPASKKSQRTAAKVQRKTAIPRATPGRAVTVAREPDWRVGLQLDGSVFAFDPSAGTHQVIAAPIVRQILGMAALLRPAA